MSGLSALILAARLADLTDTWLEVRCCRGVAFLPLRQLAMDRGGGRLVGERDGCVMRHQQSEHGTGDTECERQWSGHDGGAARYPHAEPGQVAPGKEVIVTAVWAIPWAWAACTPMPSTLRRRRGCGRSARN
jgi:hypothetical protein